MTTPRSPRRRHHHEPAPDLELPSTFSGDAHEPDRDALAWLAAGHLEVEADTRHRRSDADWQVVAPALADAADSDVADEFWGDAPRWRGTGQVDRTPRRRSGASTGTQAPARSKRPWRRRPSTTVTTGSIERTRTHHVVPTSADGAVGAVPGVPEPPRPSERPRTLPGRFGAIAVIALLVVPVAIGIRSTVDGNDLGLRTMAVNQMADMLPVRPAAGTASEVAASADGPADVSPPADATAIEPPPPGETDDADPGASAEQMSVSDTPCAVEYTVVAGDYWLRLVEEAGVDLAPLLAANGATIETPLHPGDDICLPEGASRPAPPTTEPVTESASEAPSAPSANDDVDASSRPAAQVQAPATTPATTTPSSTAPPVATAPPTTAPPATTAPPTTRAPATTAPAPAVENPSEDQVRQIIREVWPEDQHEMAFTVARRESGFRADAYNGWCCHGIFQIHWQAHRSWLQGQGVTSSNQLYDARTNIELAYEIYQRSGGWGPWSQTAH